MPAQIFSVGQIFGKLKVISEATTTKNRCRRSICRCECGNITTVHNGNLRSGLTKSCGCLRVESAIKHHRVHGYSVNGKNGGVSTTYHIWQGMLNRCEKPQDPAFSDYGGRGITVCEAWHEFTNFLKDMGERPDGLTLDRKNNNLGYSKENCRWATWNQQARNRRGNVIITARGVTGCLTTICEQFGVNYYTTHARISRGWTAEDAIFKPVQKKNRKY